MQRGTNCIADLVRSVPGGLDAVDTFMILYVCWLRVKHCRKPNSPFPSVCNSKWFKHVHGPSQDITQEQVHSLILSGACTVGGRRVCSARLWECIGLIL